MRDRVVTRLGLVVLTAFIVTSCAPPASEVADKDAVVIGEVVEEGEPAPTVGDTEAVKVSNCGILDGTMTKEIQLSYTASYAFMWEYGGEVGFDFAVEPLGVGGNIGGAFTATYGQQWESSKTQSVGFPLTAERNTDMEYTIAWTEMWQAGYIPVHTARGQERVEYRYLVHIDGNIVGSRDLGCVQVDEGDGDEETPPLPDGVPTGYVLYDGFTAPEEFTTNWWIDDPNDICDVGSDGDVMWFDCRNDASDNLLAGFHHSLPPSEVAGLAAMIRVERMGGPFQIETSWVCQGTGEQRAYQLALGDDSLLVNEYYPQEGWRVETLGEYSVTPGKAHLLQMERTDSGPLFSLDGQPLALDVSPNWQDCFSIADWGIPFYVWPGNSLEGQIEWIAVKE
ncbi:MAG: hypothetical protein JXA14_25185 [Anaerolineae bacterium]|nr:hypothetical protein [Anaerolineae bacterium]